MTPEIKRDNIKIGLSAGILITMVVTSVGFAFHAGRVRQMVESNTAAITAVTGLISGHLVQPGHAVLVERVWGLQGEVTGVRKVVDKNRDSLQRIETKLNTGPDP